MIMVALVITANDSAKKNCTPYQKYRCFFKVQQRYE